MHLGRCASCRMRLCRLRRCLCNETVLAWSFSSSASSKKFWREKDPSILLRDPHSRRIAVSLQWQWLRRTVYSDNRTQDQLELSFERRVRWIVCSESDSEHAEFSTATKEVLKCIESALRSPEFTLPLFFAKGEEWNWRRERRHSGFIQHLSINFPDLSQSFKLEKSFVYYYAFSSWLLMPCSSWNRNHGHQRSWNSFYIIIWCYKS